MATPRKERNWYLDGKKVRKGTPGAVLHEDDKYSAKVRLPNGKRRHVVLLHSYQKSVTLLKHLEDQARLGKWGMDDESLTRLPTSAHLDAFELHLKADESSPKHVAMTMQRVRALLEHITDLRHLTAARIEEKLSALRTEGVPSKRWQNPKKTPGISVVSRNHYLRALRIFVRWLLDEGRIDKDPIRRLKFLPEEPHLKHERRALSPEDFAKLLAATRASVRVFRFLTGEDRYFLYLVAASTGFRAAALASLTKESFQGNAITIQARKSKSRKAHTLPLPKEMLADLQAWMQERTGPLWPRSWYIAGAEMIRLDLAEAGLPYKDAQGQYYDFHALRSQAGTDLARAGVPLQTVQAILQHSDPKLTAKFYTKLNAQDLVSNMEKVHRARK